MAAYTGKPVDKILEEAIASWVAKVLALRIAEHGDLFLDSIQTGILPAGETP
jgi:hypothetical protein